jgi:hypothetical protein
MAEARMRVWNDHTEEYVEEFRGDTVRIPAKGFVEMGESDANQFCGQHTPIIRDGLGNDLKPKKLRRERLPHAATQTLDSKYFVCQVDRQMFETQSALDAHIAAHHTEVMLDDEAKNKLRSAKK